MSTPAAARTRKDWETLATDTRPEGRAFIDGKLVGARDGKVFEDVSPINGKVVAEVELSISPDYNVIEIVFKDKTSLSFNIEPCFQVVPELVNWKSGEYKPLKRWRPVHSV